MRKKNIQYIPLGQLRSRLQEIDKTKEIVVFCMISRRGYEAECIFEGEGVDNVKCLKAGLCPGRSVARNKRCQ